MKKHIITVMLLVLCILAPAKVEAATASITEEEFVAAIEKITGEGSMDAIEAGSLYEPDKKLNRQKAAYYINQADILLYGTKHDKPELLTAIKENKRLSDMEKIPQELREDVYACYQKGYIKGYSNGSYTRDRQFKGTKTLTKSGALAIVKKLDTQKDLSKFSPDGQMLRTTKLPKNAKRFPYILASFPNSFYDAPFGWDKIIEGTPGKYMDDWAYPVDYWKMTCADGTFKELYDEYGKGWEALVEKNLRARLSYDYRTSGNDWYKEVRNTYFKNYRDDEEIDGRFEQPIKDYMKLAKKNKVILKCKKVIVEPSSWYYNGGDTVRCYIEFTMSAKDMSTPEELVYQFSGRNYFPKIKKNVTYKMVCDIRVGSYWYGYGYDEYVMSKDYLSNWGYKKNTWAGKERFSTAH